MSWAGLRPALFITSGATPIYNNPSDRVLSIYLTLTEYPILSARIRHIMRKQLFARGILSREAFDVEARQKAIQSQLREGLHDPYGEEAADIWGSG